jgi:hypothetical protein
MSFNKCALLLICAYFFSLPTNLNAQGTGLWSGLGCDGVPTGGSSTSRSQSQSTTGQLSINAFNFNPASSPASSQYAASQLAQQQAEARRQQALAAEQALAQQRLAQQQQAANQQLQFAQGIMGVLIQHPAPATTSQDANNPDAPAASAAPDTAMTQQAQTFGTDNSLSQSASATADAQQQQEQQNQAILANEKQEFRALLGDSRTGTFAAGNSSPSATLNSVVPPEVYSQTVKVLANEMFHQVLNGEMPDVSKAARTGTVSVIKDAAVDTSHAVYDAALNLLPPDEATVVRAYRIPLSYLTMNFSEINAAYSDLYQKDFADKANKMSTDLRPATQTLPGQTLELQQTSQESRGNSWKQSILNQIASCDDSIEMWTNSIDDNKRTMGHCNLTDDMGILLYNSCVQNIEHATAEIQKLESQKAALRAKLLDPPSFQ